MAAKLAQPPATLLEYAELGNRPSEWRSVS